jgi:hypothetical protein
MKRIGIILDDLFRHHFAELDTLYEEYKADFEQDGHLRNMVYENHPLREVSPNEDWFGIAKKYNLDYPQFYDFLFVYNGMRIFSSASETSISNLKSLNEFIKFFKLNTECVIYACGIEKSRAKLGTFSYLAKNGFTGDGVLFFDNYDTMASNFDMIVTTDPYFEFIKENNKNLEVVKNPNTYLENLKNNIYGQ